ncbi:hypothetical protein LZ30DRAFT_275571 [Colletotrichum cereale]|nr:hypothetical protein LZ30DRAFT_275571 [Colletotrichum cereale]
MLYSNKHIGIRQPRTTHNRGQVTSLSRQEAASQLVTAWVSANVDAIVPMEPSRSGIYPATPLLSVIQEPPVRPHGSMSGKPATGSRGGYKWHPRTSLSWMMAHCHPPPTRAERCPDSPSGLINHVHHTDIDSAQHSMGGLMQGTFVTLPD